MMKVLALLACVAMASAEVLDVSVEESVDVWKAFDTNTDIAAQLSSLEGRVTSMEALGDAVGSAISVSQSSTARLDELVAEVAALKQKLAVDVAELESGISTAGQKQHLNMLREHASNTAQTIVTGAVNGIQAVKLASVSTANTIRATLDAGDRAVDEALANIDDLVADGVEQAKKLAPFSGTPDHIKQVTGIDYKNTKSYLVWEKASQSSSGYVRGRKFYKVKFNLAKPGYFTSGSDELFMACRALSMALFEKDGKERDLVPPCNHWSRHQNVGGQGQCIMIERSYFSHCGGGGYWSWQIACGGIKESDLRGIVGYESTWENYDRHLCHRNGANSHTWCNPYSQTTTYQYTLCTSNNVNFKV